MGGREYSSRLSQFALATPSQKDSSMRKYLSMTFAGLVVIIGASTFLSACNTVEGAGKDVSKAGHEVSEEAREHK
jgi:predicted small secreted protein